MGLCPPQPSVGTKSQIRAVLGQTAQLPLLPTEPVVWGGPVPALRCPHSWWALLDARGCTAGPAPGAQPQAQSRAGCVGGELAAGASCLHIPAATGSQGRR